MNLYFLRHGEIEKKYLNTYIGSTDAGLSNYGKTQAKKLADFLKNVSVDVIYTSTLKRAKQTANPLSKLKNITPIEEKKLSEIDFGPWEGKTFKAIQSLTENIDDCSTITSGGEKYSDFVKRVRDFFKTIEKNHMNDTVVAVSHKGVIREAYKYFLKDDEIVVDQAYGCINYLKIENGNATVVFTNKIYV